MGSKGTGQDASKTTGSEARVRGTMPSLWIDDGRCHGVTRWKGLCSQLSMCCRGCGRTKRRAERDPLKGGVVRPRKVHGRVGLASTKRGTALSDGPERVVCCWGGRRRVLVRLRPRQVMSLGRHPQVVPESSCDALGRRRDSPGRAPTSTSRQEGKRLLFRDFWHPPLIGRLACVCVARLGGNAPTRTAHSTPQRISRVPHSVGHPAPVTRVSARTETNVVRQREKPTCAASLAD